MAKNRWRSRRRFKFEWRVQGTAELGYSNKELLKVDTHTWADTPGQAVGSVRARISEKRGGIRVYFALKDAIVYKVAEASYEKGEVKNLEGREDEIVQLDLF